MTLEGFVMTTVTSRSTKDYNLAKPTWFLIHVDAGQLSDYDIYKRTTEGFHRHDVDALISAYQPLAHKKITSRIIGKSIRTLQRQNSAGRSERLDALQSAVAFQYAKVLEDAINVFGDQQLAEQWLSRPCKYLDGDIPLDVIHNPMGFQAVEDYLERIKYGVYQ